MLVSSLSLNVSVSSFPPATGKYHDPTSRTALGYVNLISGFDVSKYKKEKEKDYHSVCTLIQYSETHDDARLEPLVRALLFEWEVKILRFNIFLPVTQVFYEC